MATATPIATPPGAGFGPEILGPPPITAAAPKKLETVGGIPVGPDKSLELGAPGSPGGSAPERPATLLHVIEDHAGEPPHEILEAVAETPLDAKKKTGAEAPAEPSPAEPKDADGHVTQETASPEPGAPKDTPEEAANAKAMEEKKAQETRQVLEELGKLLIDARDTRASLVALGLSAGNTPMANELREHILDLVLMGSRLPEVPEEKWTQMQGAFKPRPQEQSPIRQFFVDHHFPEAMIEDFGGPLEGAQRVLRQQPIEPTGVRGVIHRFQEGLAGVKQGEFSPLAQDLQRGLGWNEENPIPTNAEALAKVFGDDPENASQIQAIIRNEKLSGYLEKLMIFEEKAKHMAPEGIHGLLIVAMMFEQIAAQGSADATPMHAGGH